MGFFLLCSPRCLICCCPQSLKYAAGYTWPQLGSVSVKHFPKLMNFVHSLLVSRCLKFFLEALLRNIEVEMKTDHPVFLYQNS